MSRGAQGLMVVMAIALAIMVLATLSGCAPAQRCQTERALLDAVSAGVGAADATVDGSRLDGWDEAMHYGRGAVALGEAAVGACELTRDGAGWQAWLRLAAEAVGDIMLVIVGGEDPGSVLPLVPGSVDPAAPSQPPPPELVEALRALQVARATP